MLYDFNQKCEMLLILLFSFSLRSFSTEIEIDVKDLIAVLPTDLPVEAWEGDLEGLSEDKKILIFKAADLQAQAECRQHYCGLLKCVQLTEARFTARPFRGGYYREIDEIFVNKGDHALSPGPTSKLIKLEPNQVISNSHIKNEFKPNRTAYFSYLKCTDQPSPVPSMVIVSEINLMLTISSELKDWFQIIKSVGPGILGAVKEGYLTTKETAKLCPKTAAKWGMCRLLSIITPGMAGSQSFGDLANRYALQMESEKAKTESNFMKRDRLKRSFEEKGGSFSKENIESVRSLIGQIDSRLNTQFDHGGELPHLLNQLDAILSLPKLARIMTAQIEGQAIKDFFEEKEYPQEIQEQIYEAFALHAVAQKRNLAIPVQPIVLKGLPGTGKTSLLTELSKKVNARLCLIQLNTTPAEIERYLLGGQGQFFGSQNSGPSFGKIVDCLIQPYIGVLGSPYPNSPKSLRFEPDTRFRARVLSKFAKSGGARNQFLGGVDLVWAVCYEGLLKKGWL